MFNPAIEDLVRRKVAEYNMSIGHPVTPGQGFAEGGSPQMGISAPAGMIPGPVTPGGGDNTKLPVQTGEYIIPVDAVMGIGLRNGAQSPGDALAIGKSMLDKEVSGLKKEMGNPNPPRNAGIGIPPQQGVGFEQGGSPTDKDKAIAADKAISAAPTVPNPSAGIGTQNLTKMSNGTVPAPTPPPTPLFSLSPGDGKKGIGINTGNIDRLAAQPGRVGGVANAVQSVQDASTGNNAFNGDVGSPIVSLNGPLSPEADAAIRNRVDWSPGSQNMKPYEQQMEVGLDGVRRPHYTTALEASRDAVKQRLGYVPLDYDQNHSKYDALLASTHAADEGAKGIGALRQSEITKNQAQADYMKKGKPGTGQPNAYKDVRAAEEEKLNAEGVTDPIERSRRILEAEAKFKKDSSGTNGRMYSMLNKETGQIELVSSDDRAKNPDKYGASAQDPNVKAWTKNVAYRTANANFVNTIDNFGSLVTDIAKRYNLNSDPKLANYTIQQLIKLKGMGSGEVASLNNVLTGLRGEMSKMAEGSLGVAGAKAETAKKYEQSVNDSMPLKELQKMIQWASKEGQSRLSGIDVETNRLRKELGIKEKPGESAGSSAPPNGDARNAELVKKDLARGLKPSTLIGTLLSRKLSESEVISALRGAGMSDQAIASAHDEYVGSTK
jgi:hypothetical protein